MADSTKKRCDLKARTKDFACRIIALYRTLPKTSEAQVPGRQMLRSGTSVGAHYREATRARSRREYLSKTELTLQELDETQYWLEVIEGAGISTRREVRLLIAEADELLAIFTSIALKVRPDKRRQR